MKKTVNVSLGGVAFCLEEDAYRNLAAYLNRLEIHFEGEKDRKEILTDIEARMAEHFKENAPTPDRVINLSEVDRVIGIMGQPTDIGGEKQSQGSKDYSFRPSTSRRLYRDPDNSVIGGVCAGLAHYWNIDPVIIRILFVIAVLWGGGGFLVYIILWIAIPQANSVAEKLEMRGEQVNAENIGKSFQEAKD
jgi:phage shock protein PspC (stress-responsive transcriptional regulator)